MFFVKEVAPHQRREAFWKIDIKAVRKLRSDAIAQRVHERQERGLHGNGGAEQKGGKGERASTGTRAYKTATGDRRTF